MRVFDLERINDAETHRNLNHHDQDDGTGNSYIYR